MISRHRQARHPLVRHFAVLLFSLGFAQLSVGEKADYSQIIVEQKAAVAVVKFNNPPRYTLTQTAVEELSHYLDRIAADDSVRVLILTGASEKIFISHYDVGEISRSASRDASVDRPLHPMHRVLLKLETLPKPVIAVINGRAHGGGYETALAADFRFLSTDGTVGLPEVNIGIIPGGGGTQRLPRLIGPGKAKELIMLGEPVDAATALSLGMVNRIAEPKVLMDEAMAFAEKLASRSPVALAQIKRAFRDGLHLPLEEGLKVEQNSYYTATQSVNWGDRN